MKYYVTRLSCINPSPPLIMPFQSLWTKYLIHQMGFGCPAFSFVLHTTTAAQSTYLVAPVRCVRVAPFLGASFWGKGQGITTSSPHLGKQRSTKLCACLFTQWKSPSVTHTPIHATTAAAPPLVLINKNMGAFKTSASTEFQSGRGTSQKQQKALFPIQKSAWPTKLWVQLLRHLSPLTKEAFVELEARPSTQWTEHPAHPTLFAIQRFC